MRLAIFYVTGYFLIDFIPLARKRRQEDRGELPAGPAACVADVVTPLWAVPYEEQLERKRQECEQVLQKLAR